MKYITLSAIDIDRPLFNWKEFNFLHLISKLQVLQLRNSLFFIDI